MRICSAQLILDERMGVRLILLRNSYVDTAKCSFATHCQAACAGGGITYLIVGRGLCDLAHGLDHRARREVLQYPGVEA